VERGVPSLSFSNGFAIELGQSAVYDIVIGVPSVPDWSQLDGVAYEGSPFAADTSADGELANNEVPSALTLKFGKKVIAESSQACALSQCCAHVVLEARALGSPILL
jgi:hypothetical protein